MSKQRLAGIISFVFDPLIEGPLLLTALFLRKSTADFYLLLMILFFSAFLPIVFIIYGLKRGFIDDWETTDRKKRYGFNLVCLGGSFLSLILVYFSGDQFLLRLFVSLLVLIFFYTLITFFWKISGHMTANTAFILLANRFLIRQLWWLLFLLPLIAWARLVRKKHDIWQILAGVLLSSVVILLLL